MTHWKGKSCTPSRTHSKMNILNWGNYTIKKKKIHHMGSNENFSINGEEAF